MTTHPDGSVTFAKGEYERHKKELLDLAFAGVETAAQQAIAGVLDTCADHLLNAAARHAADSDPPTAELAMTAFACALRNEAEQIRVAAVAAIEQN